MIAVEKDRLTRHELIGLKIAVIKSSNPLHLGIKGVVMDETRNTLVIFDNSKRRRVPKDDVTYGFTMPDGSSIEIEGRSLLGRPVDRLRKTSGRR